MQKFLKSAVAIAAMVVVGTSAFAADSFTAKLKMTGNLWGDVATAADDGFKFNDQSQKDSDENLQFRFNGEKSGAEFNLKIENLSGAAAILNGAKVWFKPADAFKVTLGEVGIDRYKETIDWWRAPTSWHSIGSQGIKLDITPMDGLAIQAMVAPGYGKAFNSYAGNLNYGAGVKYNISGFGSVAATFQDVLTANWTGINKLATVGFDVNAVPNLYVFENVGFALDNAWAYSSLNFDTYATYKADALNLQAWIPVKLTTAATSVGVDVKATYNLGSFNVYGRMNQGADSLADYQFNPEIRLGATTNVDKASLEAWVQLNDLTTTAPAWCIPFVVKVGF